MSRMILIWILFFLTFSFVYGEAKERGFVWTDGGLILRKDPTKSGAKIALIPKNEIFEFLSTGVRDNIDGQEAAWWFVNFKGQSGWIFSGYAGKIDESFYDSKNSLFVGNPDIRRQLYADLQSLFRNFDSGHCQIDLRSKESFVAGDENVTWKEHMSLNFKTSIDTFEFGSKYEGYVYRITDVRKEKGSYIIHFESLMDGTGAIELKIDPGKKNLRWISEKNKKLPKHLLYTYAPVENGDFICHSNVKTWLYGFLK